ITFECNLVGLNLRSIYTRCKGVVNFLFRTSGRSERSRIFKFSPEALAELSEAKSSNFQIFQNPNSYSCPNTYHDAHLNPLDHDRLFWSPDRDFILRKP